MGIEQDKRIQRKDFVSMQKAETPLNIWEENNILCEYYQNDNYYIMDRKNNSKKYLIFCSGNGLYFPDTVETFMEKIANRDRYEWQNVIKSAKKLEKFEKIIFIRDIYKTWYVKGINNKVDTIDKLAEMLKKLVGGVSGEKNPEVIIVGNSAGGYIATLLGVMLEAKAVYNFSGQYDITYGIQNNPFWNMYSQENGMKYQNIVSFVEKSEVPIFYLYPGLCENDIKQHELVEHCKNVYSFAIDEKSHGTTTLPINYQYLFSMSQKRLAKISRKYNGKLINKKRFLVQTAGLYHAVVDYVNFRIGRSNYNNNANL